MLIASPIRDTNASQPLFQAQGRVRHEYGSKQLRCYRATAAPLIYDVSGVHALIKHAEKQKVSFAEIASSQNTCTACSSTDHRSHRRLAST